jgi:GTPase SAR1 family protein
VLTYEKVIRNLEKFTFFSFSFKVCICGQKGVGKTTVLHHQITAAFSSGNAAECATVVEQVGEK